MAPQLSSVSVAGPPALVDELQRREIRALHPGKPKGSSLRRWATGRVSWSWQPRREFCTLCPLGFSCANSLWQTGWCLPPPPRRQGGAHLGLFELVSAQFWGTTALVGQQLQSPELAQSSRVAGPQWQRGRRWVLPQESAAMQSRQAARLQGLWGGSCVTRGL